MEVLDGLLALNIIKKKKRLELSKGKKEAGNNFKWCPYRVQMKKGLMQSTNAYAMIF